MPDTPPASTPDPAWAAMSLPQAAQDAIASRFVTLGIAADPITATYWASAAVIAIEVDLGARITRPRKRTK